jgi:hypothetical protein
MDRSMRTHARWFHGLDLPSDQDLFPVHIFDAYEWTDAMDLFDHTIRHRITTVLDLQAANEDEEEVEEASDDDDDDEEEEEEEK